MDIHSTGLRVLAEDGLEVVVPVSERGASWLDGSQLATCQIAQADAERDPLS